MNPTDIEINASRPRAKRAAERDGDGRGPVRVRAIAQVAVGDPAQADPVLRPVPHHVGEARIIMPARDAKGERRDAIAGRGRDARGLPNIVVEAGLAREGEAVRACSERDDGADAAGHHDDAQVMGGGEGEAASIGLDGRRRVSTLSRKDRGDEDQACEGCTPYPCLSQ